MCVCGSGYPKQPHAMLGGLISGRRGVGPCPSNNIGQVRYFECRRRISDATCTRRASSQSPALRKLGKHHRVQTRWSGITRVNDTLYGMSGSDDKHGKNYGHSRSCFSPTSVDVEISNTSHRNTHWDLMLAGHNGQKLLGTPRMQRVTERLLDNIHPYCKVELLASMVINPT